MISLRETLRRVVDVVLVSCFLSATALAQSGEVSLRGQVTDQSGAVVPGIPVGLIGPGGAVREATTEASDSRPVADEPCSARGDSSMWERQSSSSG